MAWLGRQADQAGQAARVREPGPGSQDQADKARPGRSRKTGGFRQGASESAHKLKFSNC